jgi:WXG100 family type VII secretion target
MGMLNVNYDETRTVGNNIKNKAQEFESLLNEIKNTNKTLAEVWIGADAQAYTNKIEEQANEQITLKQSIEEVGQFMVNAGNAYEETMESNRSAIK